MNSRQQRVLLYTLAEIACEAVGWRDLSLRYRARALDAVAERLPQGRMPAWPSPEEHEAYLAALACARG